MHNLYILGIFISSSLFPVQKVPDCLLHLGIVGHTVVHTICYCIRLPHELGGDVFGEMQLFDLEDTVVTPTDQLRQEL